MVLVRQGTVRALRGEIYICKESALAALETQQIPYERVGVDPGPTISSAAIRKP
jgi:hypothetical protein